MCLTWCRWTDCARAQRHSFVRVIAGEIRERGGGRVTNAKRDAPTRASPESLAASPVQVSRNIILRGRGGFAPLPGGLVGFSQAASSPVPSAPPSLRGGALFVSSVARFRGDPCSRICASLPVYQSVFFLSRVGGLVQRCIYVGTKRGV